MGDWVPDHRLETADEMHVMIEHILTERRHDAAQSQYDVGVCIRSVAAAREAIEEIPVEGSAIAYGETVNAAMDVVCEKFYDSDGEYTSKGMVGDVGSDIYHLLQTQKSPDRIDIDRNEARSCLKTELAELASVMPRPLGGVAEATVKAETKGESGFSYFVKMTYEQLSDERFAIIGKIYCSEDCICPVLEARLECDNYLS